MIIPNTSPKVNLNNEIKIPENHADAYFTQIDSREKKTVDISKDISPLYEFFIY